ncbi:hypothetical protein L6R52_42760 [Myxococcota bacterium]|nr:hypothetical protein [Myxococcota bacterium]
MSWDPVDGAEPDERQVRRAWLVSPAVATALFFAAQLVLAISGDHTTDPASRRFSAAAANAPAAIPVETRVVTQIRNADGPARRVAAVPASERELLDILDRHGTVVFSASEVDTVGTQEAEFDAGEVGVITAAVRARRATFTR